MVMMMMDVVFCFFVLCSFFVTLRMKVKDTAVVIVRTVNVGGLYPQ